VLHRVGHVHVGPLDAGALQGAVEQPSGWTDERFAGAILRVARLFTHQHQARAARPFPEDGLRRPFPELAPAASLRSVPHRLETRAVMLCCLRPLAWIANGRFFRSGLRSRCRHRIERVQINGQRVQPTRSSLTTYSRSQLPMMAIAAARGISTEPCKSRYPSL
jgi:hypothetical protein